MVKKQNKGISDSDLLTHVFRDVKPLPGRKIKATLPIIFTKSIPPISASSVGQIKSKGNYKELPYLQHGDAPGVDKRTAQRLRRGRLNVEARLDLHGLKQGEAHSTLNQFILRAYENSNRCVLVITGKGALSKGGGVLRKMVPLWLNQNPNRNLILSFSYSTPVEGGTGALYVLLKRKRT